MTIPNRIPSRFKADPDKVLASLKRKLNDREAWDELPEWGVIYADAEGCVCTSPFPVPPQLWIDAGDPKHVLGGFLCILTEPPTAAAAAHGEALRRMLPKSFAGLYVQVEGWGPPEDQALELHKRMEAGGSVPRFETMNGRREFRLGTAVDAEGNVYYAQQARETMRLEGFYTSGVSDEGGKVGGEVPALMSQILEALLTPTPAMQKEARRNGL
jgi:hypothetical protein